MVILENSVSDFVEKFIVADSVYLLSLVFFIIFFLSFENTAFFTFFYFSSSFLVVFLPELIHNMYFFSTKMCVSSMYFILLLSFCSFFSILVCNIHDEMETYVSNNEMHGNIIIRNIKHKNRYDHHQNRSTEIHDSHPAAR